jgi:hypothetical protein
VKRIDVWAVVKDPGEAAGMLPVVVELRKAGLSVWLITNGWAAANLIGYEHTPVENAEALMTKVPPRLLLVGLCANDDSVGRDLIPLLRGKSISIIIQDLWGMPPSYVAQEYQPDYVITNDEVDKGTLCNVWPKLDSSHIFTTGFPALDKYASVDIEEEDAKVRTALGLREDIPLVLFAGQGFQTSHALGEVVWALNRLRMDCYFIPRPHPRFRMNYASEAKLWQEALAGYRGRLVVDWFGSCTSSQLIAAAAQNGVVISMYSTMLLEAAALRGQAVSVLYPETGMQSMKAETGLEQSPLVSLGCTAWAKDRESLVSHLGRALTSSLGRCQRPSQKRHIHVDGQNARRVAEVIRNILR